MVPTSFPESTHCLSRPIGMTEDQCEPLSVANAVVPDGSQVVISCWKLTTDELREFMQTGRVWLVVVGQTMPPVSLTTINPFE